jgi:hypothetical protein
MHRKGKPVERQRRKVTDLNGPLPHDRRTASVQSSNPNPWQVWLRGFICLYRPFLSEDCWIGRNKCQK